VKDLVIGPLSDQDVADLGRVTARILSRLDPDSVLTSTADPRH